MGTFGENFSKSFGKKTGNALGNMLYGKASDDKRVRIRTEGDVKMTSDALEQEKLRTEQLEAQLRAEQRNAEMKQEAKEKERHLNQLDDIRMVSFSGTDINENVAILSQLIALLTYDEDQGNDNDTEDQIKQKQVIATATTKIKTGLAISKGIDPANGVILALEQEFKNALNAVNERDAKNKLRRKRQLIMLIAYVVIITGLMVWGVMALFG